MLKKETKNFIHVLYYVAKAAAEEEASIQLARIKRTNRRRLQRICVGTTDIIGFEELTNLCDFISDPRTDNAYVDSLLDTLYDVASNHDNNDDFSDIKKIISDLKGFGYPLHFAPDVYVKIFYAMR